MKFCNDIITNAYNKIKILLENNKNSGEKEATNSQMQEQKTLIVKNEQQNQPYEDFVAIQFKNTLFDDFLSGLHTLHKTNTGEFGLTGVVYYEE